MISLISPIALARSSYRRGATRSLRGRAAIAAAAAAVLALACGGGGAVTGRDETPAVTVKPGLSIVSGANQSDTVLAMLPENVVVQAGDAAGNPAAARWVIFKALPEDVPRGTARPLHVCLVAYPNDCDSDSARLVEYPGDGLGRARVRVKLGKTAGVARIAVAVPSLGLTDTISFTVAAGAPVRLALDVRDSAVYVGNSYAIGGALRDAHGNVATGPPVTYTPLGAAAAIEGNGVLRGLAVGRGGAIVQSGTRVDTAWVSVTPRGTIAAFDEGDGTFLTSGIATVEMDGSGYRMLARTKDTYEGTFPNWTVDGQIVFESGAWFAERAFVTDLLGNVRRLTPDATPTQGEIFNAPARDGSVFVSAAELTTEYEPGIWRVAGPGALPARVGPNPPPFATNTWRLSVSPTSGEVAFSDEVRRRVSIMRVSDGSVRELPERGEMPRWSPNGEWIAFNDDTTLHLIRPDGTGRVRVSPRRFYHPRADWSPDGRWLIARARDRLELIDVTSGATLPLPFGKRLTRPAWRE